jgi:GT2 family glycosyltransferase
VIETGTSLIIPTYNGADVLAEQLRSVASQSAQVDEVVIADNGSTDETVTVALTFSDRLPIRVVDASARRGNAAARNLGVQGARGSILLFLDQDDVADANWVVSMLEAVEESRLLVGRNVMIYSWPGDRRIPPDRGSGHRDFLPYGLSNNMAMSRTVFECLGGFDETFVAATDLDLCWRAQEQGFELLEVRDAVVFKRRKSSFGGAYRQHRDFGRDWVRLYVLHREHGMRRRVSLTLKELLWVAVRVPAIIAGGTDDRSLVVRLIGNFIGRVEASWKHRTFYI